MTTKDSLPWPLQMLVSCSLAFITLVIGVNIANHYTDKRLEQEGVKTKEYIDSEIEYHVSPKLDTIIYQQDIIIEQNEELLKIN